MNGPIPFTDRQLEKLAEMYRSGKSLEQVGDRFGLSTCAVRARLRAMGEPTRKRGRIPFKPTSVTERCKRLRARGKTIAYIARLIGLSQSAVYRHLARN